MSSIIAGYDEAWLPYSPGHEQLAENIEAALLAQVKGTKGRPLAYAAVGTFGSGKTQLLFHVYKRALANGLLPVYVLAEHLFEEILGDTTERVWLPSQVAGLVERKLASARDALTSGSEPGLRGFRGSGADALRMEEDLIEHLSAGKVDPSRIVLLVDELEQQYHRLQVRVQADERSPLRDWLEAVDHLKIVALAPAGIYEMGGADQTRVTRWVLPAVDPAYVRRNSGLSSGLANAAWWFSRGKPRHLAKALRALQPFSAGGRTPDAVLLLCRDGLDRVGQEPSAVPAAELSAIESSEYSKLLLLEPTATAPARRMVIDVAHLDVGAIADKMRVAFAVLDSKTATLTAQYTATVMRALANDAETLSLPLDDLPDLLQMGLDLLIEYEHASPGIAERLGEILQLYDVVASPMTYATLATLWDLRETTVTLPISCRKLRQVFPFPVMNPTVKMHLSEDMRRRYEGKGVPIWRWVTGDRHVLIFGSSRDLASFTSTDEFKSEVLPDGRSVDCIVPAGAEPLPVDALRQWLTLNGKLRIIDAPPLIFSFLMSAAGEIGGDAPGNLEAAFAALAEDTRDPLTGRKVEVYKRALQDLISGPSSLVQTFLGTLPGDATSVWGSSQIGDHDVAVLGCALAFQPLNQVESQLLSSLRELFRGGMEGRGSGGLRHFIPRGGYPSLADDLLPARRSGRQPGGDRAPILRLRGYLGNAENELRRLARIVSLEDFRRLHSDEDYRRVLDAVWRAVRREYGDKDLAQLIGSLAGVVSAAERALRLEELAIRQLRSSGINFGDAEGLVRNVRELQQLLQGAETAKTSASDGAALVRAIQAAFIEQLLETAESLARRVEAELIEASRALDLLPQAGEDLLKNVLEYKLASGFTGIDRDAVTKAIEEITVSDGPLSVRDVTTYANEARQELEDLSTRLQALENTLKSLEAAIGELRGE